MSDPIPEEFYRAEFLTASVGLTDEEGYTWVMSLDTRSGTLIINGNEVVLSGKLHLIHSPQEVEQYD